MSFCLFLRYHVSCTYHDVLYGSEVQYSTRYPGSVHCVMFIYVHLLLHSDKCNCYQLSPMVGYYGYGYMFSSIIGVCYKSSQFIRCRSRIIQ